MGDIAEQTLAGAISTGTHGTGGVAAGLAAQVVGLELVTGTGEVVRATPDENPDILEMARVGLGALGILTRSRSGSSRSSSSRRTSSRCRGTRRSRPSTRWRRPPPRRHVLVPAHRPDAHQAQRPARGADLAEARAALRLRALARRRLPVQHGLRALDRGANRAPAGDPADEPAHRPGCSARAPTATSRTGSSPPSDGRLPGDGVRRPARGRARRRCARRAPRSRPPTCDQLPGRDPGGPRRRHPAVDGLRAATRSTSPSTPTATPTTRRTSRSWSRSCAPTTAARTGARCTPATRRPRRPSTPASRTSCRCATGSTRTGCSPTTYLRRVLGD